MARKIFFLFILFIFSRAAFATDEFDSILKKNFADASFLQMQQFPLGTSFDGKLALYGQFGKECVFNKGLNKSIVFNKDSDADDEPFYLCQPEAIFRFSIMDLHTDKTILSKNLDPERCGPFQESLVKIGKQKLDSCKWISKNEILSELEKHHVLLSSAMKLESFPVKVHDSTFDLQLVCEGRKFKKIIKDGKPKVLRQGNYVDIAVCTQGFDDKFPNIYSDFDEIRAKVILKRSDRKLKIIGTTRPQGTHNFSIVVNGVYRTENPSQIVVLVSTKMGDYHGGYSLDPQYFGAKLDSGFK